MSKRSQDRLRARALSGNDLGQVVHTHVPLSPSSTIWYQPHHREGKRQYMGEVWPTAHIAELCLHSLPAQGLINGDEHRPYGLQSGKRALWTTGLLFLL